MALKDCIRRLEKSGKPLNEKQLAALKEAKDAGLTDDQAVRKVVLMAHQKVIDITTRARNEGATVAPFANPVSALEAFQSKALQKIADRKTEIKDEKMKLSDRLTDLSAIEGHVRTRRVPGYEAIGMDDALNTVWVDLADDRQVLDAMLQMSFAIPRDKRELLGLKGKDANEMLQSFREMQDAKQSVVDQIGALEAETKDLDRQVSAIFSGVGEQTFDQSGAPKLTVRHNMDGPDLVKADKLGGLAVPSLAVMPEGHEFTGFGMITFIGTDELADPAEMPIFDADGYTIRFPSPEYKPMPAPLRDRLISEVVAWESIWGDKGSTSYYVERHTRDHPNPQEVIWRMMDSDAVKAWYLTEVWGEDLTPKMKDVEPQFKWGWDDDVVEFFTDPKTQRDWNRAWESPERQALMKRAGDVVMAAVTRSYRKRDPNITDEQIQQRITFGANLTASGALTEMRFGQLMADVRRKGTKEVDDLSNKQMLDARMRNNEMIASMLGKAFESEGAAHVHFKSWVEEKVGSGFGEPRIKIGNKWHEYTLENIVRKMKGKLRGKEEGFADGPMTEGLMRALVAHRFKRLEEMRARAETHVGQDVDEIKALREEAQRKMLEWTAQMSRFYTREDFNGYVDVHEAEDAARRAIVRWATSGGELATANDLEDALHHFGFDMSSNVSVPDWLVDEGMEAAMDWLAVPVPYFEAKPQRAVKFEEFAGAVIPSNAPPEVRAILQKRRIPFKEYPVSGISELADDFVGPRVDEHQSRIDATNEFIEQLNNQGERTLFQSEIGFTSGLLTAARTMPYTRTMKDGVEVGTDAEQILNTLRKQPNVKTQEMEAIGLFEWLDEMGVVTQDQLVSFIDEGGVQLMESWYVGSGDPPITMGNSRWDPVDLPESWRDEETGEFPENTYAFEPRILNWTEGVPSYLVILDEDAANVYVFNQETDEQLEMDTPMNMQTLAHAEEAIDKDLLKSVGGPFARPEYVTPKGQSRWSEYTLGYDKNERLEGTNYREIVLHVPEVGGYQYKMEDFQLSHHPQLNDPTLQNYERDAVEKEARDYWYIDARSPMVGRMTPEGEQTYRVQTYKLSKAAYGSLEDAKQYLINTQKVDAPSGANHSSHAFSEPNIIAWARVSDREGPNGEKIFFIEENQSDLHQAGLIGGYRYTTEKLERAQREFEEIEMKAAKMLQGLEEPYAGFWSAEEAFNDWMDREENPPSKSFHDPFAKLSKKQKSLLNKYSQVRKETALIEASGSTPDMPWKGDAWAELSMKRMIRLAVEGGYDQVAWTTGKQQMGLYNLSDHFSKVEWDPRDEMLTTYDNNGRMVDSSHHTLEDLPGVIGAEPTLEIKRSIDEKRSRWTIAPVYVASKQRKDMTGEELAFADATLGEAQNTGTFNLEMSPNDIILDDQDQFIGTYERKWIEENGVAFALVDENGEMVRQHSGDYQMWEYFDGAEEGRDDFAFGDELPNVTNLQMDDDETKGLKRRYDHLLVNVANRALRKLDKNAKVQRAGLQMKGDGPDHGVKIERHSGGNLGPGIASPGDFYVEDYADYDEGVDREKVQISPNFDTYEEAQEWSDNISGGYRYAQHGFDITPQIREAAMEGQTYFQNNQNKNRGQITFDDENRAIIRLSQAKDLSTFLHESAHLYLELMGDLVEVTHADPKMIDDYYTILKYLGVNNRHEIETRHHELFARSFEAYLREGKAPTAELQPIFSAYSGWLNQIYKVIRQLLRPHEQLNDEIREVFDRMVASEEAISVSEDMMAYVQLYQTAEEMGVSQEVFDVYKRDIQEEHDAEVDKLTRKSLRAVQWAKERWWKDERKKIAAEVRAEAERMPVYRALAMLQRGKLPDGSEPKTQPIKLDKADLVERYGVDFIKRLPGRGRNLTYRVKGGTDADIAAVMFGFEDADAMIAALVDSKDKPMERWIKDESDRRMKELHPDPLNDPAIIEETAKQVHTTGRSKILGAELRALRKKMAEDKAIVKATKDEAKRKDKEALEANKAQLPKRESMAQIKAAAAALIAKKRIRDINPRTYLMAERKAGRLAFQAMERKDYAKAYEYKLSQIMNFEAFRAAEKAQKQSVRDHKYLKSFDRPAKQQRMGKAGYLERIQAVLEGLDLRKISLTRIDRERLENELMAAIEAGDIVTTPEVVEKLTNPGGENWKDMTFEELAGIRDIVKQLEHMARRDLEVIINGEKQIIQEKVDEVAASIIENHDQVPAVLTSESPGKSFKSSVREAASHWLRSSSIARVLDKSGFGAVTRNVIVPLRRAMVEKLLPWQHKAAEDVAAIYKKHYSNDEMQKLGKKLPGKIMGQSWAKSDILALALHWGTESGRAAVLGGVIEDAYGNKSAAYTEQGVAEALALMTAKDWEFVQNIWDYQESYWDQLKETEQRRRGIAPQKVESLPFTIRTIDGDEVSLRGGYHHLQYTHESGRMSEQEFQDYYNKMQKGTFLSSSTRAGATFNRTKDHGRVIKLTLNTVDQNLREILRDMAIGDEVQLANRILNSKEVANAANNTNNGELLQELKLWLSDAAVGELPAQTSIEKLISWFRVGFTKSKLAFNVYVTLLQLTGAFQSMATIGTAQYMRGLGKFLTNPVGNYKMVMETSSFMNARYGVMQAFDKDVADTRAFLQSYFGGVPTKGVRFWDNVSHLYFWPIAKFQSLVDVTTWMAAYEKGMNDPDVKSQEEARYYADAQVERAQTSGLFSDRSGIERGTLGTRTRQGQFVRLWTVLISYMLAKGNIAYEKGKITDFKNPKQAVGFFVDMVMLFAVEGMASALLYGDWPGDEDEDEGLISWGAGATVESIASGIPMLREYSGAKYGSGTTPIGALTVDMWKTVEQLGQGEADEAAVKATVKTMGTLFHLPSSQVNRGVEAFFKEGDTELHEWLMGVDEE